METLQVLQSQKVLATFDDFIGYFTEISKHGLISIYKYYAIKETISYYDKGLPSLVDVPKRPNGNVIDRELDSINDSFINAFLDSNYSKCLECIKMFKNRYNQMFTGCAVRCKSKETGYCICWNRLDK